MSTPSRSALVGRAATEVSGSGPRAFDADQRLTVPAVSAGREPAVRALVGARAHGGGGADTTELRFADLGLDPAARLSGLRVLVAPPAGRLPQRVRAGAHRPAVSRCRCSASAHALAHPQVVATNRHVSCGGPDLASAWPGSGDTLSGTERGRGERRVRPLSHRTGGVPVLTCRGDGRRVARHYDAGVAPGDSAEGANERLGVMDHRVWRLTAAVGLAC